MCEFIPTLGNLIKACDDILGSLPIRCYPDYAKIFENTKIETVVFSGRNFEKAASEWAKNSGWSEPT